MQTALARTGWNIRGMGSLEAKVASIDGNTREGTRVGMAEP